MVHGDFHIKNVMVQDGEPLLIDMDTLVHGDPVFDLAATYNAYVGFGAANPAKVENFMGLPYETTTHLWDLILREYLAGASEEEVKAVEDKVRIVSSVRLLSWPLRHGSVDSPGTRESIEVYKGIIEEALPRVQTLAL